MLYYASVILQNMPTLTNITPNGMPPLLLLTDRSVQTLLSQGANPNLILDKGVAAIHLAVGKESEKGIRCLKLILQHGADPNLRCRAFLVSMLYHWKQNVIDHISSHSCCIHCMLKVLWWWLFLLIDSFLQVIRRTYSLAHCCSVGMLSDSEAAFKKWCQSKS